MEIGTVVIGVLTVLASVLGAWFAARGNVQAKRTEATLPPYDQLAARVSTLEAQVDRLSHGESINRAYIRRLLPAWRIPPMPMPPWLLDEMTPHHTQTPGSVIEPPNRKEH